MAYRSSPGRVNAVEARLAWLRAHDWSVEWATTIADVLADGVQPTPADVARYREAVAAEATALAAFREAEAHALIAAQAGASNPSRGTATVPLATLRRLVGIAYAYAEYEGALSVNELAAMPAPVPSLLACVRGVYDRWQAAEFPDDLYPQGVEEAVRLDAGCTLHGPVTVSTAALAEAPGRESA